MELYRGKYFEVVFQDWCQEFPGACIISGHKEKISDMTSAETMKLLMSIFDLFLDIKRN